MMELRLEVLAKAQRYFWEELAPGLPKHFVLYGGTAIALRYGHRKSVDFDFFTDKPLGEKAICRALPALENAIVLERDSRTLVVSMTIMRKPVKLSFFAGLKIGRVGSPTRFDHGPWLAAPIDLLATKLKALHDRVEPRDYQDIETLLRRTRSSLDDGINAARALFGTALNPLDTAKAVGWFKDGDLMKRLPAKTRRYLTEASSDFKPDATRTHILSRVLAPAGR
jgi:hypothetical protein